MRPAKTTIIHAATQIGVSVIGFLTTLYFARVLGAGVLGQYFVIVALTAWIGIPGIGVSSAITKRMSEGVDQPHYLSAGLVINSAVAIFLIALIFVFRGAVNSYVGADVDLLLYLLVFGHIIFFSMRDGLKGQKKVAYAGIAEFTNRLLRAGFQVALVLLGYELTSLITGHGVAFILVGVAGLGVVFLRDRPVLPKRVHFEEIVSYARYSWLGIMKSRAFSWTDVLILNLFVSSTLVGVYEVSWGLASVLALVGMSIQQTLFPEVSELSTKEKYEEVRDLVETSLVFSGIILIPGFFGALVLGPRILRIYGTEFVQGQYILLLLIVARTVHVYESALVNFISAVNRPDLAFKINLSLIFLNVLMNFSLIYMFGWYGAALATGVSLIITFVMGYYLLSKVIGQLRIPFRSIGHQVFSASLMALLVLGVDSVIPWRNNYSTVALAFLGAAVYSLILVFVSERVRSMVMSFLPVSLSK